MIDGIWQRVKQGRDLAHIAANLDLVTQEKPSGCGLRQQAHRSLEHPLDPCGGEVSAELGRKADPRRESRIDLDEPVAIVSLVTDEFQLKRSTPVSRGHHSPGDFIQPQIAYHHRAIALAFVADN